MPRFATFCVALLLSLSFTSAATAQRVACEGGSANGYSCNEVDLLSQVTLGEMSTDFANDIWGWTDSESGKEYALVGLRNGTGFVDISDPEAPIYLGKLPTHTQSSIWRDIKVYADHAFVVSEAGGHGMQVFDLTQLRGVTTPTMFSETAHYGGIGSAHNLGINEDTGFAYVVGAWECSGGLHMVDIQDPASPSFAGCFGEDGYTHDVQCVVYDGPDAEHVGQEICLASNEDTVTIVDVTDKQNPVELSQATYPNDAYTHQGWLTEDSRYFIANDEIDEMNYGFNTRTLVFDVSDLDEPEFLSEYYHPSPATDHNLYIKGHYAFQANYKSGLRIVDLQSEGIGSGVPSLAEVAFFDTNSANGSGTSGAWSNYPFFESGIVIVSDGSGGLFVLDPKLQTNPPVDTETTTPGAFVLTEAYPNPFTDRTQFTLRVAESQPVEIVVHDVLGRRVVELFRGTLSADEERTVVFDGSGLPSGAYFVRVSGETFAETRQVTLTH